MDHRGLAIFKNESSGFHESPFLIKSFPAPVPIEIGVIFYKPVPNGNTDS